MGTFVKYKDKAGEFRWYLTADNNEKIADSGEGYTYESSCDKAITLVRQLAPTARLVDKT